MNKIDLHMHSAYSIDGEFEPKVLIEKAKESENKVENQYRSLSYKQQKVLRELNQKNKENNDMNRPLWPMIVLKTPKGWTGPKVVKEKQIEGTFRAHQVPMEVNQENIENLKLLEDWMKSYKPEECFDEEFVCENCGAKVKKLGYSCRNHCPVCLYSKHVDIMPGDRYNTCSGLMKPIGIEKYKNTYKIIYKCSKCNQIHKNIIADDDIYDLIVSLSVISYCLHF